MYIHGKCGMRDLASHGIRDRCVVPSQRNLSTYLRSAIPVEHYFVLRISGNIVLKKRKESFGKSVLSSLQSGTRNGTQIRRSVYVRADGGNQAAAEIDGAADLFLPAVFSVAGYGTSSRGSSKRRRMEDDSRVGLRRPGIERRRVGNPSRDCGIVARYWN